MPGPLATSRTRWAGRSSRSPGEAPGEVDPARVVALPEDEGDDVVLVGGGAAGFERAGLAAAGCVSSGGRRCRFGAHRTSPRPRLVASRRPVAVPVGGIGLGAVAGGDEYGLQSGGVGDDGGHRDAGELLPDLFAVADGVVGAEGDEPPVGGDLLHAAFHELLDVEGVGILEVLDDDHEHLLGQRVEDGGRLDPAGGTVEAGGGRAAPGTSRWPGCRRRPRRSTASPAPGGWRRRA